jgi:hypothetical protein
VSAVASAPTFYVLTFPCPVCTNADCMVHARMEVSAEVLAGEGDAWVAQSIRTDCRAEMPQALHDHLLFHAELSANSRYRWDVQTRLDTKSRLWFTTTKSPTAYGARKAHNEGRGGPLLPFAEMEANGLARLVAVPIPPIAQGNP